MTPESGYTYTDLSSSFFTVAGATTTTFSAATGVVTAVFPATAAFFEAGSGSMTAGEGWLPIAEFDGNLDGNGYKITNLKMNTTEYGQGLFSTIYSSGVITNITLENVDINARNYVGGLAVYNYGTINNSYVTGIVIGSDAYIGGLVGYNEGIIINSRTTASVSGTDYIGGLGYTDGTFSSNTEITRAEMALILAKALGHSVESGAATGFADEDDIPTWAKASVAYMKQAGIVQGKGDNKFAPLDHATRAEAVTVLLNLLIYSYTLIDL